MIDFYHDGKIYSHERQMRLQHEAEQERLLRPTKNSHKLQSRLMTTTGDLLIAVGTKLKQRSDSVASQPHLNHIEFTQ